jgi:hypothetical protein
MRRLDRSTTLGPAERERYRDVLFAKALKHRHGGVSGDEFAYRLDGETLRLSEDDRLRADACDVVSIRCAGRPAMTTAAAMTTESHVVIAIGRNAPPLMVALAVFAEVVRLTNARAIAPTRRLGRRRITSTKKDSRKADQGSSVTASKDL